MPGSWIRAMRRVLAKTAAASCRTPVAAGKLELRAVDTVGPGSSFGMKKYPFKHAMGEPFNFYTKA